jgi:adenosine kinase
MYFVETCASEDGVLVHYQKNPGILTYIIIMSLYLTTLIDAPTGTCAVLVNDGERSLVTNLAAANTFAAAHIQTSQAAAIIERAKIYYSAGFFLTVSLESMLSVAKHSMEHNKIYCLNISAPFLVMFFKDQLRAIMPYADFLFANESEAAAYGEAMGYGTDVATVALKTASEPKASGTRPRVVVFTQGSSDTIVAVNGKVTSYPVDVLPKEMLVDTNGAGDAFVGGFLAQLSRDKPIDECVRAGHYASRIIIQRSGCTFPKECGFA